MAHGVARSTLSGTVRHLLIVGEALQEGYGLIPQLPIPLLCLVARVEILMDADGAPKMTSFLVEDLDEVLELSD